MSTPNPYKRNNGVQRVIAGTGVTIDESDPLEPIVSTQAAGPSLDIFARQRASELLGLTNPEIFFDTFVTAPIGGEGGETGSVWNTDTGGTGSFERALDASGGAVRLGTGSDAESSAFMATGGNATTVIGAFVPNPVTNKTYCLFLFRYNNTPDANMALRMGVAVSGSSVTTMNVGVRGASSTTHFRFSSGTDGVNSTIAIDSDWHVAEMWTLGDGDCHGSIDSETAVSYTLPSLGTCFPWIIIANGPTAAAQNFDLGFAAYVVPKAGSNV
jgi:hypothetical protein